MLPRGHHHRLLLHLMVVFGVVVVVDAVQLRAAGGSLDATSRDGLGELVVSAHAAQIKKNKQV